MTLLIVGLSHKTSSVDVREKLYLSPLEQELLLSGLKLEPSVSEAFVISTCNRTEIYALMREINEEILIDHLCSIKKLKLTEAEKKCFYVYYGKKAVYHFFTVSAGLDSLVIGEKEILGQIKVGIEIARRKQALGRFSNILTNVAVRTGKKARSQTKIGCGGLSVSWAAVEMAKKLLGTLEGKSVLIIGAGKMSHLAAGDFRRKGVKQLFVMNRTKERRDEMAHKFNAQGVGFWQIQDLLREVDVCICSASAPHYLIEKDMLEDSITCKRQRELVLIDISLPRNIHPEAADVDQVRLVSIDELKEVVEYNTRQRHNAISEVKDIVVRKCQEFYRKLDPVSRYKYNAIPVMDV